MFLRVNSQSSLIMWLLGVGKAPWEAYLGDVPSSKILTVGNLTWIRKIIVNWFWSASRFGNHILLHCPMAFSTFNWMQLRSIMNLLFDLFTKPRCLLWLVLMLFFPESSLHFVCLNKLNWANKFYNVFTYVVQVPGGLFGFYSAQNWYGATESSIFREEKSIMLRGSKGGKNRGL